MSLINVNKCVKYSFAMFLLRSHTQMTTDNFVEAFEKFNTIMMNPPILGVFNSIMMSSRIFYVNGDSQMLVLGLNLFDNYVSQKYTSNKVTQYLNLALTTSIISKIVGYNPNQIFTASCLLKMITDDYNTNESSPLSEQTEELE